MIIINLCLQHLGKPYIYLLYFSCFFPTYLTFNVNCLLFFVRVTFQYLIYYRKKRNMTYKCNKENKIIHKIHHRLKRNRFTKKIIFGCKCYHLPLYVCQITSFPFQKPALKIYNFLLF